MFARDSHPKINIMACRHNEKDSVKKVLMLPIITLLFLTSCRLLESQAESTLEPIPPTLSLIEQFDFESGLIPEYRGVLQDLSDASFYSIEFIIADAGRWSRIGNENIPVGLPVRDYSGAEYSGIIYGRGALFFEILREEMGEEAFEAFIKSYVQNNAWKIGTTELLRTAAETQCGCDLSDLFKDWIYP